MRGQKQMQDALAANSAAEDGSRLRQVLETAGGLIVGKPHELRLALTCMLAGGHLLIEDVPGVGKTTLAHVLARLLGLDFQRIQFTADMLPADIVGVSIYDREDGRFHFHPGPVFAQLVLADEINRATPKTQSALLEAMEERQVTADGETRALPEPFFVIATQNPRNQVGTFGLPESQLDRFLMRISLGYPDADAERALLAGGDRREMLSELEPSMDAITLQALQGGVDRVHVADVILDYVQSLVAATRNSPCWELGLSPRAGLALLRAARAWALIDGRMLVVPEDVQAVLPSVAGHRLVSIEGANAAALQQLVENVAAP
jgi:MoxR-like ATPase